MDTEGLYKIVHSTILKPIFHGIFPSDKLVIPSKFPAGFIANTDDSSRPGEHWCAYYMPDRYSVEYFDSFGLTPYIFPAFFDFIENKIKPKHLIFNEHQYLSTA